MAWDHYLVVSVPLKVAVLEVVLEDTSSPVLSPVVLVVRRLCLSSALISSAASLAVVQVACSVSSELMAASLVAVPEAVLCRRKVGAALPDRCTSTPATEASVETLQLKASRTRTMRRQLSEKQQSVVETEVHQHRRTQARRDRSSAPSGEVQGAAAAVMAEKMVSSGTAETSHRRASVPCFSSAAVAVAPCRIRWS